MNHPPIREMMMATIRELAAEELEAIAGGSLNGIDLSHYVRVHLWVSPLDIHSFNPQPDPPARVQAAVG